MECWLEAPTPSNNDFCDAIDEIMKPEQDNLLLGDPLSSGGPLDLDLDSMSDLLETPSTTTTSLVAPISPTSTTDYPQQNNVYGMTSASRPIYPISNNSKSNPSTYSVLGISPKFTTLSINQHHHPFSPPSSQQDSNNPSGILQQFGRAPITINPKNTLHPPPYAQEQQSASLLGTSYPFELPMNNVLSDVKRFRSSSMNEGVTQQQHTKFGK